MSYQPHRMCTATKLLAIGIVVTLQAALLANPNSKNPNQPLAAHGTISEAKELVASLYKIYDAEEKFVLQCFERKDRPDTFAESQLSKSAAALWKARRDAERLQLMGEPAGHDLARKLQMVHREIIGYGQAYGRTSPKGVNVLKKLHTKLTKEMPKLNKFLAGAEGALGQGKLELVDQQMEAKGLELEGDLVFFTPEERKRYNEQFLTVMAKSDSLYRPKLKQGYFEKATEVMNSQLAVATSFPAEAQRISSEIAASGTATLEGEQKGGPVEAFAHVAKLWGNASAALTRAATIQWAFTGSYDAKVQPSPQELKDFAIRALASVIDATANTIKPEDTEAVYSELLKQISIVERRSTRDPISKPCESALAKLAAKDPGLSARIAAYDQATSQALTWRELFALQSVKKVTESFPAAGRLIDTQSPVESSIRPYFAVKPTISTVAPGIFGEQANWMAHEASVRLIGKPVGELNMIRLSPTSRTAAVPHDGRHYANVPVPLPSDPQVADLKTALLVDATHGPLSFKAADAVSSAELQDYVAMGGVIQTVHLEAGITRFIGLPDAAYTLVPLGNLPKFQSDQSLVQQTCWRFDLAPMWAQNRYFFVQLPKQ